MADSPDPRDTSSAPPDEISRGLFATGRRLVRAHPFLTDALLTLALLAVCTVWLAQSRFASVPAGLLQGGLILTVAVRRTQPTAVFAIASALALVQWLLGYTLAGDVALLVLLYTVAAHESRLRALLAAALLEGGAVMAAVKWDPARTVPRSFLFLSATVVAALFAGLTMASGSRYLTWMDERARRLEVERDQQAAIAAAAERTRIARELHDIVSHSLSVVVTLADGAERVSRRDPDRAADAMAQVSEVGRHALSDMRTMLGVLRSDEGPASLTPPPDLSELERLLERVRATGLAVDLAVEGSPFPLGASAELTVYRIVQESLTNTIRHASAGRARVRISYDAPTLGLSIDDDGTPSVPASHDGHGLDGMQERAALHGGELRAGPRPGGGWSVATVLHLDGDGTRQPLPA